MNFPAKSFSLAHPYPTAQVKIALLWLQIQAILYIIIFARL
jgi:hypothetical protein